MDNTTIDNAFERLAQAMKDGRFRWGDGCACGWKDAQGETIDAPEATDFMIMRIRDNGVVDFKHNQTRNYVFLLPDGSIMIPDNGAPFALGYFKL
jgi:hypothetical protein